MASFGTTMRQPDSPLGRPQPRSGAIALAGRPGPGAACRPPRFLSREFHPMPAQHSQDEIDAIRRLIIAGYSRGQIAAQLGLTKNTVSGLAHRHIEKAIKGRSVSIGKPRRKKVGRPKLAAIAPTAEVIPIVAEERPTLWVDLGAGQCSWPIAGSGAPGMVCCGADRAGSGHPAYCRRHRMMAVSDAPPSSSARCYRPSPLRHRH